MTRPAALLALALLAAPARAGYEQPSYIDGGQSSDGRFVVTAAQVTDPKAGTKGGPPKPHPAHGPFQWRFTWKDTKTGDAKTFDAKGVQGGQVYAHLFVPPGGETFALFNHVTIWHAGKSHGHGAGVVNGERPGSVADDKRTHEGVSRRVIVYRKDGTILKELGMNDFLTPAEWDAVVAPFNRAHWLVEYAPLGYKTTPRFGYALYRLSPDHNVLEFRVVPAKGAKERTGRTVRVDLTSGAILPADWKSEDKNKIPVRPFVGPDKLPDGSPAGREAYIPSLDPVREEGKYAVVPPPAPAPPSPLAFGPARVVKDGGKKFDTPTWLPAAKCLVFTDLDAGKLFRLDGEKTTDALAAGGRGKVGPDGRWYGVVNGGGLASWVPGEEPKVIAAKASADRDWSVNDLAVSPKGRVYVTTLKDPEKGRLTVVDPAAGTVKVAWDGIDEPTLTNPNGVAVSPDGKLLYVGISSYADRKHSAIYRFPLADDGAPDVKVGKAAKWAAVTAPDGLAVGPDGRVYATAGPQVVVLDADGKNVGALKIPKGSGTNLAFGGADGRTLFVTTNETLYAFDPK